MIDLWAFYFANVVGWQLHPGYFRENAQRLNITECAELVDQMVKLTNERSKPCPGGSQEQH